MFTLSVPDQGVGTGQIVIFSSGQNFSGSIQALPDPANSGGIVGLFQASGVVSASVSGTTILVFFTGEAAGGLSATVEQSASSNSPTGVILTGSAGATFSTFDNFGGLTPVEQVTYDVEGLQQSTAASASSSTLGFSGT